jgi:preprotein translocase subunit SecD
MKSSRTIAAILMLVFLGGCTNIQRLTDQRSVTFTAQIETSESNKDAVYKEVRAVIENRVRAARIDAEVMPDPHQGDIFRVKIYQPEDIQKIKQFLFSTYRLELKKVVSPMSPTPLRTFKNKQEAESELKENQVILPFKGYEDMQEYLIVEKDPIITGRDVRTAKALSLTGRPDDYSISFTLKPDGAVKFGDWTAKNINSYLAIILNDEVQSAPFIRSQISDSAEISGKFSKDEAENIALSLNSGYLPANIKLQAEEHSTSQIK